MMLEKVYFLDGPRDGEVHWVDQESSDFLFPPKCRYTHIQNVKGKNSSLRVFQYEEPEGWQMTPSGKPTVYYYWPNFMSPSGIQYGPQGIIDFLNKKGIKDDTD